MYVRRAVYLSFVGLGASSLTLLSVSSPSPAAPETGTVAAFAPSAMSIARATGVRVEEPDRRDAFTRVFANPDGTWTAEIDNAPSSAQDASGEWHSIDTELVSRGGRFAPRFTAADVTFSNGGDKVLAIMSKNGKDFEWRWPRTLPVPQVSGDILTYLDAAPSGGDLVVAALATGFSHSIVLDARPSEPIDLRMPVMVDGAELSETPSGGLEIESASGEVLVSSPPPMMWDAVEDAAGDPANVVPVDSQVGVTSSGTPTVTLSPDDEFLSDPDTVYPVTVDPSYTALVTGDVWMDNPGDRHSLSEELRVGTNDGGSTKARSYIHFNSGFGIYGGMNIVSANLVLRNWYSTVCNSSAIEARQILDPWDANAITWSNQPTTTTTNAASYSTAKGATGCAAGDSSWDVKGIVQRWANGGVNEGIRLAAVNENSNYSYRKYRSANYAGGGSTVVPRIDITYVDPRPSTPTMSITPCVAPCYPDLQMTSSLTPKLMASASDVNSSTLTYNFELRDYDTAQVVATSTKTGGQGTQVEWQLPAAVLNATSGYEYRATVSDGTYTTVGAWTIFTIKHVNELPAVTTPTVSPCPGECTVLVSTSKSPALGALVEDPDSMLLKTGIEVRALGTTTLLASEVKPEPVSSGTNAMFNLAPGLVNYGGTYEFRISAVDEFGTTWLPWTQFALQAPIGQVEPTEFRLAGCISPCDSWFTASTTPTFLANQPVANVAAPTLKFELATVSGMVVAGEVSGTPPGQSASWTVPANVLGDGTHQVRVGAGSTTTTWTAWHDVTTTPNQHSGETPSSEQVPVAPEDVVSPEGPVDPAINADENAVLAPETEQEIHARATSTFVPDYKKYAPVAWIHDNERDDAGPLYAKTFLANADLAWSHGYNTTTDGADCWDHKIAGTIVANDLKLGEYSHKERESSNCGHKGTPWDSNDFNIASFETRAGPGFDGNERDSEGMYVDLDNRYRDGQFGDDPGFGGTEPVYVTRNFLVGNRRILQYYFLWGRSFITYFSKDLGFHEGDWEHIAIWVEENGIPSQIKYFHHGKNCILPWRLVPKQGNSTNPKLTVARNSHGNYPYGADSPNFPAPGWDWAVNFDDSLNDHDDEHKAWNTYRTAVLATDQPWYGYTGGWGQVGKDEARTGPWGPNPQRDYNQPWLPDMGDSGDYCKGDF